MKIIDHLKRPASMAVLAVLAICASLVVLHAKSESVAGGTPRRSAEAAPVIAVLQAQHAAAINCTRRNQILIFPYATRVARIDATACPDDFFQAWQKYVSDVQTLAAIRRANAGNAIVHIGAAVIFENPAPLLGAMPEHPEQAEISFNTAVADWQNVKHVAFRYGIKLPLANYSQRHTVRGA